ncbi:hypothetical protein [Actinomadura vinacea]|uniref:hypothetical protein n=1 Tax=Actinomadura vinacea TaxID=115336 RepID=UPI0031DEF015
MPAPVDRFQPADRNSIGRAQPTVNLVSAVQAPPWDTNCPGQPKSPADWKPTEAIWTVDGDPGGTLQWDSKTGRVRVYDIEPDGHYVRGEVYAKGALVGQLRAGEAGKCDEVAIRGYKPGDKVELKICLGTKNGIGYCNGSDSGKWPKPDREQDYCDTLSGDKKITCIGGVEEACSGIKGPAKEHCMEGARGDGYEEGDGCSLLDGPLKKLCEGNSGGGGGGNGGGNTGGGGSGSGDLYSTEKPDVPAPPDGSPRDKDPYVTLPRGHAEGVSAVAGPLAPLLRWLVWTVLGACVLGFMIVGGNMAIKHKRSEAGAHAAGLGWVMLASVVAASGAAVAFISLLIDPL